MARCVTLPDTPITMKVLSTMTSRYSMSEPLTAPQLSIRPTAAGMNMIGIVLMRNVRLPHIADLDPLEFETGKQEHDTVNAGRYREGNEPAENLTGERERGDYQELYDVFHLIVTIKVPGP